MKKKLLAMLLAVTMVMALSACSSSPADKTAQNKQPDLQTPDNSAPAKADEQITINLWHSFIDQDDSNRIATDEFIASYTAEHPNVKVEQHILEDSSYKDKLLTEFSGSAQNVDVFNYWGAGRAGDLANAGKLLCIEDYLGADTVSLIKEGADNNFRYGGKLYAAPLASWMLVLYCNTEIFEANGIKLPGTYDEWLDACKKLTAAGILPLALGGGVDDGWLAAFVYEGLANRTVGSTEEMKVLNSLSGFADNPGFHEAAEKMIELTQAGAFGNSPLEIDEVTATAQFLTGAAAMALEGTWYTNGIYESEDSAIAGKVKAIPFPMVTGGKGKPTDYMGGFIDGVFVNKNVKNPEIAADFAWNFAIYLSTHQHETGEGFTPYNTEVDESDLYPLGRELADLANTLKDGVIAWDTLLPGDLADIHIDACQALLQVNASADSFIEAHMEIFNQ